MSHKLGRRKFALLTGGIALSTSGVQGVTAGTTEAESTGNRTVNGDGPVPDVYRTGGSDPILLTSDDDGFREPEADRESSVITQQAGDDVEVAITISPPGDSFSSSGTMDVWAGTFDASGSVETGIENEDLTIRIVRPDGTEETFDLVTDANGGAHLQYDFSETGRGDGIYSVDAEHDATGVSVSTSVPVGTGVALTTRPYDPIYVGEEATFAFLARNGESPESGVELELRVEELDGATVVERTVETDADGFATVSFTPQQSGRYRIEGIHTNGTHEDSGVVEAMEITGGHNLDIRHAISGDESTYGGYLRRADGMARNTEFVLRFVDDPFDGDREIVLERELTTDENGYFLIDYELPSTIEEDLDVEAELLDGTEIGLTVDRIRVNQPSAGDAPDDPVSFDASISGYRLAPGQDASVQIEAEDDGEPITDATIELFLRYGYDGPPALSTTLTTDADGTASVTHPLPETAPDGSSLRGTAVLQYGGETYTSSIYSSIESYDIRFDPTANPGEGSPFSITVTDTATEEPVEGVPLAFDAHYGTDSTGSFATGSLRSGGDGEDSTTVAIPEDVRFNEYVNYVSRTTGTNSYRWLEPNHPGSLSLPDTLTAGETVDIEFTTPDDGTATGIVFSRASSPRVTTGTRVSEGEVASLSVPDHAGHLSVHLWATDENGQHYRDRVWTSVETEPETRAVIDLGPEEPAPGETVTFDGSGSTAATAPLTYDWDLGDGTTAEGATVEHAYEDAGEYDVTLTVTDADGQSDTTGVTVVIVDSSGGDLPDIDVTGDGAPATDTTGNGLLNDVNGDEAFTIIDVQVFFEQLQSDAVQNNPELFDFSGTGGDVGIADVQALFEQL